MYLNLLLSQAGLDLAHTVLLRHQDGRVTKGRTPFKLWRDDRPAFELYQSRQRIDRRPYLKHATQWVSFVVPPTGEALLGGVYKASYQGLLQEDTPQPHTDEVDIAESRDVYNLVRLGDFSAYEGRLVIEWGAGTRAWIQRADKQDKKISELKRSRDREPPFPGFLKIIRSLSEINTLAPSLIAALSSSKGVHLLTLSQDAPAIRRHGFG